MRTDYRKVTQAVDYLLNKDPSGIGKLKLIKLIWAADRYHVRKYGRFVTEDDYWAMHNGPVGSMTKDVVEFSANEYSPLTEEDLAYVGKYISNRDAILRPMENTDEDMLSETDKEALDFAWNTFHGLSQQEIIDFTHKYPEWKNQEAIINSGQKAVDINEADFFENPSSIEIPNDPFMQNMSEADLQLSREMFLEYT